MEVKKLMFGTRVLLLCVAVFFLFLTTSVSQATAGINQQIPFYGTLTNVGGAAQTGNFDMIFRFYDAPSGGTLLDTSTHTVANSNPVTVTSGEFSVLLGSGTGNTLDGLDFNDDTIYVGLTIGADSEMIPRERLAAAPYAFNADTVDGLHASSFLSTGTTDVTFINATTTNAVVTNFTITGALTDSLNAAGTNGYILQTTGGGVEWVATSSLGFGNGLFTGLSDTQSSLTSNRLLFANSGGTAVTDSSRLTFDGTIFTIPTTTLDGLLTLSGSSANIALGSNWLSGDGDDEGVYVDGSGNVGIGTTSPSSKLDVWGDLRVGMSSAPLLLADTSLQNITLQASSTSINPLLTFIDGDINFQATKLEVLDYFASTTLPGNPLSVDVSGNYAYVSDSGSGQIWIFDITDPSNITFVSKFYHSSLTGVRTLAVQGNFLFAGAGNFVALDVSDPTNPVYLDHDTYPNLAWGMTALGQYVYVVDRSKNELTVYDVSDPKNIQQVAGVNGPTSAQMNEIVIQGKYAYVSNENGDGITVFDISSPENPIVVGQYQNGTYINAGSGIAVSGKYAYITGYLNDSVTVLDVSDPANPTHVSTLLDSVYLNGANDIMIVNNYAVVASEIAGLIALVDISDVTNPIIAGSVTGASLGGVLQLDVSGDVVYGVGFGGDTITAVKMPSISALAAKIGSVKSNYSDTEFFTANTASVRNGFNVGGNTLVEGQLSIFGKASSTLTTNAPQLVLGGPSSADSFLSLYSGGNYWSTGLDITDNSFRIAPNSELGSSDVLTITSSGNVGIGTTTPSQTLTVDGSTLITGALYDNTYNAGTNGNFLMSTGSGFAWTATSSLGLGNGTFTGLSDTQSSLTSNRLLFANSDGTAVTDSAGLTFDGTDLNLGATKGLAFGGTRMLSTVDGSILFGEDAGLGSTSTGKFVDSIAIGFEAGSNISNFFDTDYNVFIGYQAGKNNSVSSFTPFTDNTFIGRTTGLNTIGGSNTFIGALAGSGVEGSYNTLLGPSTGYLMYGDDNFSALYLAGASSTGSNNIFINEFAGQRNVGSNNNFQGYEAGQDNVGSNNNFFGYRAGNSNIGSFNNFIGYQAAGNGNVGIRNEFLGYQTGYYLQATNTVAIGSEALFGPGSAYQAVNNTALGYRAGYSAQTGASNNILLGYQAADSLTTGANNIIIGYDVEAPSNTGSNQLNIGNLIFGTGLTATGTDLATGNIGIGTSSPRSKLDVWGDFRVGTLSVPTLFGDTAANWVGVGTASKTTTATTTERLTVVGGGVIANNPSDPQLIGEYVTSGSAEGIDIVGEYAYIADGATGLLIMDITDPSAPSLLSVYDTGLFATAVTVSGRYAYVTDINDSLVVVDVSNPLNPLGLGRLQAIPTTDIVVSGRYAYLSATLSFGLVILDISDPSNLKYVSHLGRDQAYGLDVSGRYAYLAADHDGLNIIDISDPFNPVEIGRYDNGKRINDVTVSGRYAYITQDDDGIQIIDISDPTNPTQISEYDTGDRAWRIALAGDYLYINGDNTDLTVLDVSDPTTPMFIGSSGLGRSRGLALSGRYAYVINIDSGLKVFDIGGSEFSSLFAGSLGATQASIQQDLTVGQNTRLQSNLSVGNDTRIGGNLTIQGYSSSTDTVNLAQLSLGGDTVRNSFVSFIGGSSLGSQHAWSAGLNQADNSFRIASSSGLTSNAYFTVAADGNIGIGTTTPSQKLTIDGTTLITGALYDNTYSAGNNGNFLMSTGAGFAWTATSSLGLGNGTFTGLSDTQSSLTANRLLFVNSGGTAVTDSSRLTFDGTIFTIPTTTLDGLLTLSGSSANIALGSNYLSGDGDDEGVYVDGSGNVGIGTSSPNAKLTIAGNINIDNPSSGFSLMGTRFLYASTTNGSIVLGESAGETFASDTLFNVALGYRAGQYASTTGANYNSYMGYRAGENNTGAENNLFGRGTGLNNAGDYNSFFGFNAGLENIGNYNNLLGYSTGYNNTGSDNAMFGRSAGYNNIGSDNIVVGRSAGFDNTGSFNNVMGFNAGLNNTGSYSNILGYQTGLSNTGSNNNLFGYQTGYANTGSYNELIGDRAGRWLQATNTVAIGSEALFGPGSAYQAVNNTALGYRAGYSAQTGASNNILLGYQAADSLTTGANNIIIGYDVEAPSNTGSNQLNIGNLLFGTGINGTSTALSNGNIGIGTIAPSSKLDVWGDFRVGTSSTPSLFVDVSTGRVGIGTTTLSRELTVAGDVRVGVSTGLGCIEDYDGALIGGTCASDKTLKTNIVALTEYSRGSILENLVALTPVTYNWNSYASTQFMKNENVTNIGLIAQDVEESFPELIIQNGDIKQVKFASLQFYIIQAIKEMWTKLTGLEEKVQEIDELKTRIETLEDTLNIDSQTESNILSNDSLSDSASNTPSVSENQSVGTTDAVSSSTVNVEDSVSEEYLTIIEEFATSSAETNSENDEHVTEPELIDSLTDESGEEEEGDVVTTEEQAVEEEDVASVSTEEEQEVIPQNDETTEATI